MSTHELSGLIERARQRERFGQALPSRDWLVYGAGRTGRAWAAALAEEGCNVCGFIDQHVKSAGSTPVFRLDDCPDGLRASAAVLIGIHNPGVPIGQVRSDLLEAGYRRVWLLQDLVDHWPSMSHFWLAPSDETLPFSDDVEAGWEALADTKSRLLYAAILDMRLNCNASGLPEPKLVNHYFPDDLPLPLSPVNFIDCGAYTGDTIESFKRGGLHFGDIAAFEPDPAHYSKLCKAVATERAHVFPCGVWDSMSQLRFTTDDAASHISADGQVIVQTVSLDQALPNFPVNYIKMDVEGAEGHALAGARSLIAQTRPRLAISVYHKPRDLWELMALVRGWNLGYEFHLRSHAYNSFDTVLYALPKP